MSSEEAIDVEMKDVDENVVATDSQQGTSLESTSEAKSEVKQEPEQLGESPSSAVGEKRKFEEISKENETSGEEPASPKTKDLKTEVKKEGESSLKQEHSTSEDAKVELIPADPIVKTYGISKVKYPQNSVIVSSRKPNLRYIPLKTGLAYDVRMRYHAKIFTSYYEYIDPHPEDPRRIYRIYKILAEEGLINDPTLSGSDEIGDLMVKIPIKEAQEEDILEVHTKEHLNFLKRTTSMTKEQLLKITESGDSVYFNHDSFFCAKLSCGGVIEACKAVVEGRVKNSFAIVRPPGHHSEPEAPGGFCLFSNVAVAAKYILKHYTESVRKIVIIDWDVHHGNGTQKCFYDDPRVLYISLHRFELGKYYPGTPAGDYDQAGQGAGKGYNVNIPWPQGGMTDADYIYAFNNVIIPICYEFNPDLVIISSGFDAAEGDMIGQCHVSPGCYGHMLNMLKNLAKGHLCVALEGGYNLDSISISALAVAKALLGEPPEELKTKIPCSAAIETIHKVKEFQSKYWKSMRPGFASISDNNYPDLNKNSKENAEKKEESEELTNSIMLSDAIRSHQSINLKEKFGLINLPLLLNDLSSNENGSKFSNLHSQSPSFDNQILATPDIFQQETICILVHDPFEIYGHVDPLYGNLDSYSSVYLDPTEKLINWVINERKFGFIDVSVPTAITNVVDNSRSEKNTDNSNKSDNPGEGSNGNTTSNGSNGSSESEKRTSKNTEEYNNIIYSQELLLYLWDNYLKLFKNMKNLLFFGVGDSYNGIVYLLGHRQVINTSFDGSSGAHDDSHSGSSASNGNSHSNSSSNGNGGSHSNGTGNSSNSNVLHDITKGKVERACMINFLAGHNQLRPIIPLIDENLTDWYYRNSLLFTSFKNPIWTSNDNYNKRPRKKFGRVIKSELSDNLYDIFLKNYEEAIDFVLDTLEEGESSSEDESD